MLVGDRAPFVVGGCVAGGVGAQERCGGGSAEPPGGGAGRARVAGDGFPQGWRRAKA